MANQGEIGRGLLTRQERIRLYPHVHTRLFRTSIHVDAGRIPPERIVVAARRTKTDDNSLLRCHRRAVWLQV
jgi:hypothetical protein